MNTPGDFGQFAELMKKLVSVPRSEIANEEKRTKAKQATLSGHSN
jgi:hypothetical protein